MSKISKNELKVITDWLIVYVFRNSDIMYSDDIWNQDIEFCGAHFDLIDVIATLHNLLYQEVTGEKYDYMFHWANKIGAGCIDDCFDTLMLNARDGKNLVYDEDIRGDENG